jgi:glycosyltransferase involved in cell wall biosynthesis
MCKMFYNNGHEVFHYGVETSNPLCTENIEYIPYSVWDKAHGTKSIEKDYEQTGLSYSSYQFAEKHLYGELEKRTNSKTDVILNGIGWWSHQLKYINNLGAHIEFGIGHPGAGAPYQVFESYAYQNHQYSNNSHFDKKWTGAVIPGYIDEDYFYYDSSIEENKSDPYLLFLGRVISDKGVELAAQLARHRGIKLKVAGHGNIEILNKYGGGVEYCGVVGLQEKIDLIRKAHAMISLTHYVEPFGNSHAESLMLGTPVISTDWGVYTETIKNNINGFRCRSWRDMIQSIDAVKTLDRKKIASLAYEQYSLKYVYPKFNNYFQSTLNVHNNGWYA